MKKFIRENWFKISIVFILCILVLSAIYYAFLFLPKQSQILKQGALKNQASTISASTPDQILASSFICPEAAASPQAETDAVAAFIRSYAKFFPNNTVGDMYSYRYNLLVSHSCDTTLKNMLEDIQPTDQEEYFLGNNYGPQVTSFVPGTGVWSSYFTLNGEPVASPDKELILNFYLQNIWKTGNVSAQDVAEGLANNNTENVDYKFTTPDSITKLPDYFIFSDATYPDQGYAYVYVTKVSSIQNSAFSIIYSQKITDTGANLKNDIATWFQQDFKSSDGVSTEISNMGVDTSWINYLVNKDQS